MIDRTAFTVYHENLFSQITALASPPDEGGTVPAVVLNQDYYFTQARERMLRRKNEILARLDYADECRVKTDAVRSFWQVHGLPAQLVRPIIPSPLPRGYRATSKRRVYVSRGGVLRFCMGYGAEREETLRSTLEPESHNDVYSWLRKALVSPAYRNVGRSLNSSLFITSFILNTMKSLENCIVV